MREQPVEAAFGLGATAATSIGQTFFISLFVPVLVTALPIDEGGFGTIYGAGTLLGAFALPFIASRYDTTPLAPYTRRVLYGLAAAALMMAAVRHPVMLLLAVFGLRLCGPGLLTHVANTTMAKGFERRRGLALGLTSLGYNAGEALLPPLTAMLLTAIDWRFIWVGIALLYTFAVPAGAAGLLRRARFETFVAADYADPAKPRRSSLVAAFRLMASQRKFWWLLPVQVLLPMLMTAAFLYQAPIALAKGWSPTFMASLFALFALARAVTSLVSGSRIDRSGALKLAGWVAVPVTIAFLCLAWGRHPAFAVAFFILSGCSGGSAGNVLTAVWAELYGPEQLGSIKGLTGALAVFSSAAGPALTGLLLSAGVGYSTLLTGFAIATGLGAWAAFRAR